MLDLLPCNISKSFIQGTLFWWPLHFSWSYPVVAIVDAFEWLYSIMFMHWSYSWHMPLKLWFFLNRVMNIWPSPCFIALGLYKQTIILEHLWIVGAIWICFITTYSIASRHTAFSRKKFNFKSHSYSEYNIIR